LLEIVNKPEHAVGEYAIDTLGHMTHWNKSAIPVVVPVLVGILKDKRQGFTYRNGAVAALGQIGPGTRAAVPALRDTLKEVLAGKEANLDCDSILMTLGYLGPTGEPAVPDLIALVKDKTHGRDIRQRAVYALRDIGPAAAPAIPVLLEVAQGRDPIRDAARKALDFIRR
jgi:HEAT repeat protein